MSDAYETALDAVLAALVANIKGTTSFATHTYYHYMRRMTAYPNCRVSLKRDRFNSIGPSQTLHNTVFELRVQNSSAGASTDFDAMIGYVGEIVDAIEADRGLSSSYVENTEVANIEYSQSADRDTVFQYAYITVNVEHIRYV